MAIVELISSGDSIVRELTYLALFHGARRVAADCEGKAPRRERAPLASRPDLATLKRWLHVGRPYAIGRRPSALCSPLSPPAYPQSRGGTYHASRMMSAPYRSGSCRHWIKVKSPNSRR
jgi:hypothetical protein